MLLKYDPSSFLTARLNMVSKKMIPDDMPILLVGIGGQEVHEDLSKLLNQKIVGFLSIHLAKLFIHRVGGRNMAEAVERPAINLKMI